MASVLFTAATPGRAWAGWALGAAGTRSGTASAAAHYPAPQNVTASCQTLNLTQVSLQVSWKAVAGTASYTYAIWESAITGTYNEIATATGTSYTETIGLALSNSFEVSVAGPGSWAGAMSTPTNMVTCLL